VSARHGRTWRRRGSLRVGVACLALAVLACGDDDSVDVDAGGLDAGGLDAGTSEDAGIDDAGADAGAAADDAGPVVCDPLSPMGATDLVMSEIRPGEHVELHNPTEADIDLSEGDYWFCSPFIYIDLERVGEVIPAGGYLTIDWPFPGSTSAENESDGELILYDTGDFDDDDSIIDFVCWGPNQSMTRRTQAELAGAYAGPCAEAIPEGGAIHLREGGDPTGASGYDVTSPPSPLTCAP